MIRKAHEQSEPHDSGQRDYLPDLSNREFDPTAPTLLEIVERAMAGLTPDELEGLPTDGSINLDHYLYGAPKREQ